MTRKKESYLTNAPKKTGITIQTDDIFPNQKNIPGDSVDGHKYLEAGNTILAGKEIGQQNENL